MSKKRRVNKSFPPNESKQFCFSHSTNCICNYVNANHLTFVSVTVFNLEEMNCSTLSSFVVNRLEESVKEVWTGDVLLYTPLENVQILLPDTAICLAVQAFLKMCNLKYTVINKHNAEDMSPSGQVPVLKCSMYLLSGLETIVQFAEETGISLTKDLGDLEKTEMKAYISLVNLTLANAENYLTWADQETYCNMTKTRFCSVYPWPLSYLLVKQKQHKVFRKLDALEWRTKTMEEACADVNMCCKALSDKLEGAYFFGNQPTELDALVFAHVYAILSTNMPKKDFVRIIYRYPKIIQHCQRIINKYFSEYNSRFIVEHNDCKTKVILNEIVSS